MTTLFSSVSPAGAHPTKRHVTAAHTPTDQPAVPPSHPFKIVSHCRDEGFAAPAERVTALVREISEELLWPPLSGRSRDLPVHLYAQESSFADARVRAGFEYRGEILGFADSRRYTAHVHVKPALRWRGDGFDPQVRNVIAHEAAHLALFVGLRVESRDTPYWLREGFPMWIEGEVAIRGGWIETRKGCPWEGARVAMVQDLLRRNALPSATDLLADWRVNFDRKAHSAASYAFFLMLTERHRDALTAVLDHACDAPRGVVLANRLRNVLRAHMAPTRFAELDAEFENFVRELPTRKLPGYYEPANGERGSPDYIPHGFRIEWRGAWNSDRLELSAELDWDATSLARDLAFGAQQNGRRLRVSIARHGVYLTERVPEADGTSWRWRSLAANTDVREDLSGQGSVRVLAEAGRVTVTINDREALTAAIGDRPVYGAFGVGIPYEAWGEVMAR